METAIPRLSDEQKEILIWLIEQSVLIERYVESVNWGRWNEFCPESEYAGCRAGVRWDFAKTTYQEAGGEGQYVKREGHRSSVSRSLKRLSDRGLVECENSQTESIQAYNVYLTDEGRLLANKLKEEESGKYWLGELCRIHKTKIKFSKEIEVDPWGHCPAGHYEVTDFNYGTFTEATGQHCEPGAKTLTVTDDQIAVWVDGFVDQFKSLLTEHAIKARDEGKSVSQFGLELEVELADIVDAKITEAQTLPQRGSLEELESDIAKMMNK